MKCGSNKIAGSKINLFPRKFKVSLILRKTTFKFEDMHNSWLYCFTIPLELGKAKHVSQVQEE